MKTSLLLNSPLAEKLYLSVKDMPIYDYHCHLSPKEIYLDEEFESIGQIWLGGDHYKWRLMRGAGVDEKYITGEASWKEKFIAYASVLPLAVGNPLSVWSQAELSLCFGIDTPLCSENAEEIYERANEYIRKTHMSPRKLMKKFNVRFVGTTDDVCDTLEYHDLIAKDSSFDITVSPSFRTDNLMTINRDGYSEYIKKLSSLTNMEINSYSDLLLAAEARILFFKERGCIFTDVGIADFPDRIASVNEANDTFSDVLSGNKADNSAYLGFLGRIFVDLAILYRKHGLVMQLHLGAYRNPNSRLFETVGADCGCDCVGSAVCGKDIIRILDAVDLSGGLPETILYTLNPSANDELASIAGSFRNVKLGAAWWFNDHKVGIIRVLEAVSSIGYIGAFYGMLTDSRSFLSYPRHDYFRRILCSYIAELYENGEVIEEKTLYTLVNRVSYENIENLIGEKK
ncbi:MAG: glucuronate isomerase [Ruminococcaceae bacterium]|nr:glucuronate isomerase [Oscillospiraceae bacterium]